MKKPVVVIESPYKGDVERNIQYLKKCMLDSIGKGEIPFASHLTYTQILDDNIEEERNIGISLGLDFLRVADKHVFYTDLGFSEGMKEAEKFSNDLKIKVEYRSIL